jgi:hypothetical protein
MPVCRRPAWSSLPTELEFGSITQISFTWYFVVDDRDGHPRRVPPDGEAEERHLQSGDQELEEEEAYVAPHSGEEEEGTNLSTE